MPVIVPTFLLLNFTVMHQLHVTVVHLLHPAAGTFVTLMPSASREPADNDRSPSLRLGRHGCRGMRLSCDHKRFGRQANGPPPELPVGCQTRDRYVVSTGSCACAACSCLLPPSCGAAGNCSTVAVWPGTSRVTITICPPGNSSAS